MVIFAIFQRRNSENEPKIIVFAVFSIAYFSLPDINHCFKSWT